METDERYRVFGVSNARSYESLPQEKIDECEAELANSLRQLCTPWGTEQECKLFETSSILLSLGKLYLHRAESQRGISQKLSFIKCATLTTAARVRFDNLLFKRSESDEARTVFEHMTEELMGACGAKDTKGEFLSITDKITRRLVRFREEEKKFIESDLQPLDADILKSEIRERQMKRINKVKGLMQTNSSHYVDIVQEVSVECIKTLGEPPCRFAVVGLGSLAREEVTLYSDFEHVILLERGVDDSESGLIREYFRWYTVLFQIVIIGIGETLIPTVGVESLNDFFSGDRSKNWFFDLYTPAGVSFDARFPHASKTPLGAQDPASDGQKVELIQPVNKMLDYISKQEGEEEVLKNLKAVLLRTRFILGNEEIYEDFQNGVIAHMQSTTPNTDFKEQVEFYLSSVNPLMSASLEGKPRVKETMDFEKMKDFLYRPVTIVVDCMRRIYRRFSGSNLNFFTWFGETYQSIDLHDLEYAYAVACEVRLKLYSKVGHQRRNAWPGDVGKFVAKRCFTRSVQSVLVIGMIFKAVSENAIKFEKFGLCLAEFSKTMTKARAEADICDFLGFFDDAIVRRKHEGAESASTYFSAGLDDVSNIDKHFHKSEELLGKYDESQQLTFEYVSKMSFIYFRQGRHREGFDLAEKWTSNYRENNLGPLNDFSYMQIQQTKASCLPNCMEPVDVAKYADEELARSSDPMTQIVFRIVLCDARLLLGDADGAKLALSSATLTSIQSITAEQLPADVHQLLAKMIFKKQMRQGWESDAGLTFSALGMLRPTVHKSTIQRHVVSLPQKLTPDQMRQKSNLVGEWADIEYGEKRLTRISPMYGNVIVQLLLKRGIENFADVAPKFWKMPSEVLHSRAIYSALNNHISMYCMRVPVLSCSQVGRDLMAVFSTFPEHFGNPLFMATFRCLVTVIVRKSVGAKRIIERMATKYLRRYPDPQARLFTLAARRLLYFRLEGACHTLWQVLNNCDQHQAIKRVSYDILLHITDVMPFFHLIQFLQQYRDNFFRRHAFCPESSRMACYNKAVSDYIGFRFQSSATALWNILSHSHPKSSLRKKSAEMLMFVILTSWELEGYLMDLGEKYVVNRSSKVGHPAHSALYHDLFFALSMSSRDSETAVTNAFAAPIS